MNTTITKKQVFGILAAATYIRTISLSCEKEDFKDLVNPDIVHDTGTFLLALAQELMPDDKEFDGLRESVKKHLSKPSNK